MKKELKVIAVVLAGIIVFLAGFGLGTSKGIQIDIKVDGANSANSSAVTPAAPATTTPAAPETTTPATPETTTPAAPETPATPDSKPADNSGSPSAIPSSPKEIAAKYNEVLNALKKQENVTIHKVSKVNIECTDCSVSFLKSSVNSILQSFMGGSDENVQFAGGKAQTPRVKKFM